jgi:histone H3/H4
MAQEEQFKKCSTCREPIGFGEKYWSCSVSTCNRSKLALYFCSLPCWEAHVPEARHRDAWAEEQQAPTRDAYMAEQQTVEGVRDPERADVVRQARLVTQGDAGRAAPVARVVGAPSSATPVSDDDVLIVVSKLKKYVRDHSGMNTSDGAIAPLSDYLRALCREAIRHAAEDGRKTVMDRDFLPFLTARR